MQNTDQTTITWIREVAASKLYLSKVITILFKGRSLSINKRLLLPSITEIYWKKCLEAMGS